MKNKSKNSPNRQKNNPNSRKESKTLEFENNIIQDFIKARKLSDLTQKQLSEKTGITQPDISKIENGKANPSIHTLKRLADAMGMKLKIEFIPA